MRENKRPPGDNSKPQMVRKINIELQERMEKYINGSLSVQEIDELWAVLITSDYYLNYLYTLDNLKAIFKTEKANKQVAFSCECENQAIKVKTSDR